MSQKIRWTGIAVIIVLLGGLITRTQYEYYRVTRSMQYSAFGGWQLAANALYGYAHAKLDAPASVPHKFRELQTIVNNHMDSLNQIFFPLRPDLNIGVYYLWDSKSPLKVYLGKKQINDSLTPYFNRWAAVAPLYASYGRYLISQHPRLFLKYFVWKNFLRYYVPPAGFMELYNREEDKVAPIAVAWFGWANNRVYNNFGNKKIEIAETMSIISAVVNFIFIASFIAFATLGGFKKSSVYCKRTLWLTMNIWLSNMIFSVLAAPIELRYQLFPMLMTCSMLCLFLSFFIAESRTATTDKKSNVINDQEDATANVQVV